MTGVVASCASGGGGGGGGGTASDEECYTAIFAFSAQAADELSFEYGDAIYIDKRRAAPTGWWHGRLAVVAANGNGDFGSVSGAAANSGGLVPQNYIAAGIDGSDGAVAVAVAVAAGSATMAMPTASASRRWAIGAETAANVAQTVVFNASTDSLPSFIATAGVSTQQGIDHVFGADYDHTYPASPQGRSFYPGGSVAAAAEPAPTGWRASTEASFSHAAQRSIPPERPERGHARDHAQGLDKPAPAAGLKVVFASEIGEDATPPSHPGETATRSDGFVVGVEVRGVGLTHASTNGLFVTQTVADGDLLWKARNGKGTYFRNFGEYRRFVRMHYHRNAEMEMFVKQHTRAFQKGAYFAHDMVHYVANSRGEIYSSAGVRSKPNAVFDRALHEVRAAACIARGEEVVVDYTDWGTPEGLRWWREVESTTPDWVDTYVDLDRV